MANVEEILLSSLLKDVVNHGREVLRGPLMEPEAPEFGASAAGIQGDVILGVGVTTSVDHPDIVTCSNLSVTLMPL